MGYNHDTIMCIFVYPSNTETKCTESVMVSTKCYRDKDVNNTVLESEIERLRVVS